MLELSHVKMRYPASKTYALNDVSLKIEKGEFVAVLGHNGSGKSTLAKCINAINLPESGAVYVNGMDTLDENNLLPIRENVDQLIHRYPEEKKYS